MATASEGKKRSKADLDIIDARLTWNARGYIHWCDRYVDADKIGLMSFGRDIHERTEENEERKQNKSTHFKIRCCAGPFLHVSVIYLLFLLVSPSCLASNCDHGHILFYSQTKPIFAFRRDTNGGRKQINKNWREKKQRPPSEVGGFVEETHNEIAWDLCVYSN